MNILNALKQLRDDIKTWVTNNLNALNAKIDAKTIPIDSELSSTSTNPVQNKVIKKAIDNIPKFSGDYNDLTNAPNITEDDSGNMVIVDESGNIIFKADAEGIHTTAVSLDGEAAATEKYVDDAVANIDIPDVDFTGYATEDFVTSSIESAKEELSESIVAESDEWKVVDEAGNIIFSVDAAGAHTTNLTLNGESVATEIDKKVDKVDGKGLSTNDFTNAYKEKLDGLENITFEETDPTVPAWAKEPSKPTYTATEVGLGNVDNTSDADKPVSIATQVALEDLKNEIGESIVSEQEEWTIVDNQGNIVVTVSSSGFETTAVIAQSIIVNGIDVESALNNPSAPAEITPITDDEIDEICAGTLTTFLDSIASEEVGF